MTWDDDKINKLLALWNKGLSFSQIADHIPGATRGSVGGKLARLGKLRSRPENKPRGKTGPVFHKVASGSFVLGNPPSMSDSDPFVPPPETIVVPPDQRKQLVDLEEHDCRWPIGDPGSPDFHFCAHRKVAGISYCDVHAKRAYQSPHMRSHGDTKEPIHHVVTKRETVDA